MVRGCGSRRVPLAKTFTARMPSRASSVTCWRSWGTVTVGTGWALPGWSRTSRTIARSWGARATVAPFSVVGCCMTSLIGFPLLEGGCRGPVPVVTGAGILGGGPRGAGRPAWRGPAGGCRVLPFGAGHVAPRACSPAGVPAQVSLLMARTLEKMAIEKGVVVAG